MTENGPAYLRADLSSSARAWRPAGPSPEQTEIPGAGRVAWTLGSIGSVLVIAAGAIVLFGWAIGSEALTSLAPGLVSMKANAALSFVLLGASVWTMRRRRPRRTVLRRCLALLAALIGILTVAEYVLSVDLGIDELLIGDGLSAVRTSHQGRMAPTTALAIALLGISLVARSTLRPAGSGGPSSWCSSLRPSPSSPSRATCTARARSSASARSPRWRCTRL